MASSTGRPRASGESLTGLGTREDILAAAARLFTETGFSGTSTHAIAHAAGVRQASLYHHFSGKHEILLALLISTVEPSLEVAAALAARPEPATTRLWALCASDAAQLLAGEDNRGALYMLPELHDPRLAQFHELRAELEARYTDLIAACGALEPESVAGLVIGLVESVIIRRRRAPGAVTPADAPTIASAAVRILAVPSAELAAAELDGPALLAEVAAAYAV